jgi:hypothetical protein
MRHGRKGDPASGCGDGIGRSVLLLRIYDRRKYNPSITWTVRACAPLSLSLRHQLDATLANQIGRIANRHASIGRAALTSSGRDQEKSRRGRLKSTSTNQKIIERYHDS